MNGTLTILTPVPDARPQAAVTPGARRLPDRVRLGELSNGKPNTSQLLDGMLDVLATVPRFAVTVRARKESAARPAARDTLDGLAAEADLVVCATAD